MKAVCILGSPKPNGNTATILKEIFRAFEEQGIQTAMHCLSEETIHYCTGCKSCAVDGKCIHNDDVQKIICEILQSQIVILASPSYWGDITGQMKVFIDRCTPYCNTNPASLFKAANLKGIAVAVRAGPNRAENENLIHTFEHFLGHLDIPLVASFTAEGIDTPQDLNHKPEILKMAYDFAKSLFKTHTQPQNTP